MSNRKFNILIRIFLVIFITMILSSCNLLASLFPKLEKSDFEKKPNYAVNKSLYNLKNLEDYELNFKFSLYKKNINKNDFIEIVSVKKKENNINQKNFLINLNIQDEILKTNGFISNDKVKKTKFLILNNLISSDREIQLIPKDVWIELDLKEDSYKSKWLKLLMYNPNIFEKRNFWNALKNTKIFETENAEFRKLNTNNMFFYNVNLKNEEFKKLIIKFFDNLDIINNFFDKEITDILIEKYKTSGQVWINQKSFIPEKLILIFENEDEKITFELEINTKLENINKLEPENPELISKNLI
jgi:hypothetical protein